VPITKFSLRTCTDTKTTTQKKSNEVILLVENKALVFSNLVSIGIHKPSAQNSILTDLSTANP